jgi:hypothetical protein
MADSTEQVKLLASQRSTLNRKVTSLLKTKLEKASNATSTKLQDLYASLQECYDKLVDVHLEYSEIVESDDQFSEYKVVNGLELDQYMNAVDKVHKEASDFFYNHYVKFIDEQIARVLESVERILASTPINLRLVDINLQSCVKLSEQYLSMYGRRHDAIHKAIIDMNCVDSASSRHSSDVPFFHNSQSSRASSSSPHDSVSLPSTNSMGPGIMNAKEVSVGRVQLWLIREVLKGGLVVNQLK